MIKVAITGNIGSGKTIVSKIFEVLGIPVFHADVEARLLYFQEEVKWQVRQHFGESAFTGTNEVDTKKLAEIIFNDKNKLELINNIIHPLVFEKYQQWLSQYSELPYTLHESAIVFENKLEVRYDFIIAVSAPQEVRLERIIERDKVSEEAIKARMANQMNEEEKNRRANFVIINDGKQLLIPQVLKIDRILKKK